MQLRTWITLGCIAAFVIGRWLFQRWRTRRMLRRIREIARARQAARISVPTVSQFRGTAEQAETEAAWRAIDTGRPVLAVQVGAELWEFEEFVARQEAIDGQD